MSTEVYPSCCHDSDLAVDDRRLGEAHQDAAHTCELSCDSRSNDPRYPAADLHLELRPGKGEVACSPVGCVEVACDDVARERLRIARDTDVTQLALKVDGRKSVLIRAEPSGETKSVVSEPSNAFPATGAGFDFVVIGSSFCGLAFAETLRLHNPKANIVILERGDVDLDQHHQILPPRGDGKTASKMASRPWSVSHHGQFINNIHGQIQYFGGRSTYWSGWCPEPSEAELVGWPEALKQRLRPNFARAREWLGVIPASAVKEDDSLYGPLQGFLQETCRSALAAEGSVTRISPAPLAMGNKRNEKFSTPTPLIRMGRSNVQTILNCTVLKIIHDGKRATHLQTSQGMLPLNEAKLILAMSTLPSTTLVLNSFSKDQFPSLANVGKRFTAHSVSSAIARVPRNGLPVPLSGHGVQLGAVYIAGKGQAQYHLQMSAAATSNPESKDLELCRQFSANSIPQACITGSPKHVLLSCSALGELDHKNEDNWFRLKEKGTQSDLTSNGELQIVPNDQDMALWSTMDEVMFKTIEGCLSSPDDKVEYWHENKEEWTTERPTTESIRQKNAVHDASTMWIGEDGDEEAPVGLDYRLRGVENVYITGGALWPTGGSWNPVLTIVAMAMHLADSLCSVDVNKIDG